MSSEWVFNMNAVKHVFKAQKVKSNNEKVRNEYKISDMRK